MTITELRALLAKATKGPLKVDHVGHAIWCKECQRSSESINAMDEALKKLTIPNGNTK